MKRKVLITATAITAAVVVPTVANATMAYVTVPKNVRTANSVMVADDAGKNPQRIAAGINAVISPDGARLAYQQVPGRNVNAPPTFVRDLATGDQVQVAGECMGGITWAPNSQLLACQTESVNSRGEVTGDGLGMVTLPASLAGVGSVPLVDWIAPKGNNVGYGVAFSPDSSSIAFSSMPYSSHAVAGTLYVAPVANAAARTTLLTRASGPVWGPAGIAATRGKNVRIKMGGSSMLMWRTQIWRVQPDGSGPAQITHYRASGLTAGPAAAVWGPDGALIAGGIGGEDQAQLSTFTVPGGTVKMLEPNTISSAVAFSADGTRVLYESGMDGGDTSIRTIGVNGTGKRVLVKNAGGVSVSAGWNG